MKTNPKRSTLLAHNIRSTHNIGSILRTADGFGISHVIFSGHSPFPTLPKNDSRLPHIHEKLTKQIHKTALGAENSVPFSYSDDITKTIKNLKSTGHTILALEQSSNSINLPNLQTTPEKFALLLGEEVHGISPDLLALADHIIEIPMLGSKNSFNVSVATAIALYHLTHIAQQ